MVYEIFVDDEKHPTDRVKAKNKFQALEKFRKNKPMVFISNIREVSAGFGQTSK